MTMNPVGPCPRHENKDSTVGLSLGLQQTSVALTRSAAEHSPSLLLLLLLLLLTVYFLTSLGSIMTLSNWHRKTTGHWQLYDFVTYSLSVLWRVKWQLTLAYLLCVIRGYILFTELTKLNSNADRWINLQHCPAYLRCDSRPLLFVILQMYLICYFYITHLPRKVVLSRWCGYWYYMGLPWWVSVGNASRPYNACHIIYYTLLSSCHLIRLDATFACSELRCV